MQIYFNIQRNSDSNIDSYDTAMEPESRRKELTCACGGYTVTFKFNNKVTFTTHLYRISVNWIHLHDFSSAHFGIFAVFDSRQFCHSLSIQTHILFVLRRKEYMYIIFFVAKCHSDTYYLVKFSEIISQSADREKFLRSFNFSWMRRFLDNGSNGSNGRTRSPFSRIILTNTCSCLYLCLYFDLMEMFAAHFKWIQYVRTIYPYAIMYVCSYESVCIYMLCEYIDEFIQM